MNISRRELVGWLGAAAVLASSTEASAAAPPPNPADPGATPRGEGSAPDLFAPLAAGAILGSWRVERVGTLHAGALTVELSDPRGDRFQIDVCRRDSSADAPEPPARTECCDLFVANEGTGRDPTNEDHGLAAMALAEIVRSNEHRLDLGGLLTLRQRLEQHAADVRRTVAG